MAKEWGAETPGEKRQAENLRRQREARRAARGKEPDSGCGSKSVQAMVIVACVIAALRRLR